MLGLPFAPDKDSFFTIHLSYASKEVLLYEAKGKAVTEDDISESISRSKTAMFHIRQALKKGIGTRDDSGIIMPVIMRIGLQGGEATPVNSEIFIIDEIKVSSAVPAASAAPAAPPEPSKHLAEALTAMKELHKAGLETISKVVETANTALSTLAHAQSESLKALTSNFNAVQQSIDKLGNLPSKIFEDSNDKVEALLQLAQERAQAKHGESAQPKDIVNELKDLVGLVQSVKGALG